MEGQGANGRGTRLSRAPRAGSYRKHLSAPHCPQHRRGRHSNPSNTYVVNIDFHHPPLLAREAATIARLTKGRFELGIGAGHMASEYEAAGLRYDSAAVRVARLAESAEILGRLFAGEKLTFEGQHYSLRDYQLYPPLAAPIPLLIGGNGRRLLEMAARTADIVSVTGFFPSDGGRRSELTHFTAAGLEDRLSVVQNAAGKRFATLELNCLIQAVLPGEHPRTAVEPLLSATPFLSLEDAIESPFLLAGPAAAMAEALETRRERCGLTYVCVFEPAMKALAEVIRLLK